MELQIFHACHMRPIFSGIYFIDLTTLQIAAKFENITYTHQLFYEELVKLVDFWNEVNYFIINWQAHCVHTVDGCDLISQSWILFIFGWYWEFNMERLLDFRQIVSSGPYISHTFKTEGSLYSKRFLKQKVNHAQLSHYIKR